MKTLLYLLLAFPVIHAAAQTNDEPLPASVIVDRACQQAAKEHKNVLLIFHASWCGWCKKMDRSIQDSSCRDYFGANYVITHLVVDETKEKQALENPGAADLRNKLHGEGAGLPFWVVLNGKGETLADSKMRKPGQAPAEGNNTGCPASVEEVDHFIGVLKRTSTISQAQEETVRRRFRKNEL